jgi:hypothetical protein
MSIANNQRFKAGPQCLYSMPLTINDVDSAEFTAADGTVHGRGKTAGEGLEPMAGVAAGAAAANRAGVLRFGGLQQRAAAADPTAFFDIADGTALPGYTTYGIDPTGRRAQKVVGQASVFAVKFSRAPVVGMRTVPNPGGGVSSVPDVATGAAVGTELAADRWVRAYYLPWRSNAATTMQLGAAADYFLTSTLTGCTFDVYGTRTAPTVTHANNGAQPDLALSQDYMNALLEQIKADEADAANAALQGNEARFRTHDYKLRAAPYLNSKFDKGYTIQKATTHTNVVGYRDTGSGEWSFFAQQVVILGYTRTGAAGFFGARHKQRILIKQARRIWPAGGGPIDANLWG